MANMQKDVYNYRDRQGRYCVDLFAKALEIIDGDNPDCWKYISCMARPHVHRIVHHAMLLEDTMLEVKGEHSPSQDLTPNIQYNVYFDVMLMHDSKGLEDRITVEFTDANGSIRSRPVWLMQEGSMVLVGQFISNTTPTTTSGSPTTTPGNVKFKLYDSSSRDKSGLLIRCISIVPADN